MHDPDLTALRVFCQIVEAGSFTAAADRLGMAPPMVASNWRGSSATSRRGCSTAAAAA